MAFFFRKSRKSRELLKRQRSDEMKRHLTFWDKATKMKPSTTKNTAQPCPFCNEEMFRKTNKILVEENDLLWIENKYPTLPETYQTVLIETKTCDGNLSNYPTDKL